jgi:hypothetical protein
MPTPRILPALFLILSFACSEGKPKPDTAMGQEPSLVKFEAIVDATCACKDLACYNRWGEALVEFTQSKEMGELVVDHAKDVDSLKSRLEICVKKMSDMKKRRPTTR